MRDYLMICATVVLTILLAAGSTFAQEDSRPEVLFDFGAGFDIGGVGTSDAKASVTPAGTLRVELGQTQAEFALMMEDILIKATGDEALATRFIDSQSPFPDIRSDMSYFNAVMVCTSRNIMTARDVATGEFAPQGTVPGADALLAIRQMKTLLKVDF